MPIDPGRLNRRVTIQSDAKTEDGAGGYTLSVPNDVIEIWADVQALDGDELVNAMQTEARATHRVTIRWREGVKPSMRLNLGGRVLEIVSPPIEAGKRDTLSFLCRERV